ncbi:DNA repair protein Nse1 [Aureobasidium sp. EXF-10728]|nr:DNA repair protein Nse1 [Aureobasidium sp. EXF-10728]
MSDGGDENDNVYNNSHRAFLQSFLSRATLTFEQARPIVAAIEKAQARSRVQAQDGRDIQPADITEQDVSTYINVTNAAISRFDLEIRDSISQHDRSRIYALVNVSSDSITQLATTHTPDEIAFVKRCLDAMFETNNTYRSEVLAVRSTDALRLAKAPPAQSQDAEATQAATSQSLTMMQAQRMLQAMVDEGWFEVSNKDYYTLTPRALMELRGWLVETYNDDEDERIKNCSACKAIITMGERCPDLDCSGRLHHHCKRVAFRAQNNNERCPVCKKDWEHAPPVGEKAALQNRNSTNGTGASRRSTTAQTDGADDSPNDSTADEG